MQGREALLVVETLDRAFEGEAGEQVGFTDRTLRRAYKAIGIPARKESFDGPWLWRLTPASDQPPEHDDTFDFPNL